MKNLVTFLIAFFLFGIGTFVQAQNVGINSDGSQPDPSAMLDVKSSNTGLLIPQISLTAANIADPITDPATSLLIYNTATAGTSPNNVTPGYYYWNGSAWVRLSVSAGGSGTTNFVTKWSTAGSLGNSLLFDNGSSVGIGTTSPGEILDVAGRIWQTSTGESVFLGEGAGANDLMGGNQNVFVGYNAGYSNTSGSFNTAIGYSALSTNTSASNNTAIGCKALIWNTEGIYNTALGLSALFSNTTGSDNLATGSLALSSNTTGYENTAVGSQSLGSNETGYGNTANGRDALFSNTNGNYNTALGIYALKNNTTGSFNTAIGYNANSGSENLTNAIAIGSNALVESSNSLVLGSIDGVNYATASVRVGIGTTSPETSAALDITSTTRGFLPPRMTLAQRDAIVSPATGLIVWCSNCNAAGELQLFNGTTWTNITGGTASGIVASLSPTTEPSSITSNTAISGGEVTSDNGATITARGICWGTAHDPTTDLITKTEESGTTGSFTSNLTNLNASTTYFIRSYAVNSGGTTYGTEVSLTTSAFTCGTSTITVNHMASGGVAPEDKTVIYGTVTNIPGEPFKCWITRNLGASRQAVGKDDYTDASAGWYWQFNRKQGYKHLDSFRTPYNTWNTAIEFGEWEASKDPCRLELGNGWRIPTYKEWWVADNYGGTGGGGWQDWDDPWSSPLKIHAAGCLTDNDGSLSARGARGYYWSSQHQNIYEGIHLFFDGGNCEVFRSLKSSGFSLRCIKD